MRPEADFEVIIVGGGPVGLLFACELRLHDVRTLVVERCRPEQTEPRIVGLHSRSLELLDRRGLLEAFDDAARSSHELQEYFQDDDGHPRVRGHFSGMFVIGKSEVRTEQPRALAFSRDSINEILREHALHLGASIRHGHEFTSMEHDENGVVADISAPDGTYRARAPFLVGCDGGRSAVRRQADIDFPGSGHTVVARLGFFAPAPTENFPPGRVRTDRGVCLNWLGNRVMTCEWDQDVDFDSPATSDEIRASVRRVTGQDFPLSTPEHLSRFTDNTRQAAQYRSGRILLAGDAAHVHFPTGGQGLNLGLQDAFNLGWKLAAEVRGWASPTLLDTYHSEQHPVAARVLTNTRAQVALMRPGAQVDALRELFAEMIEMDEVNRYLTEMITGTWIRHPAGLDSHPLAGEFAHDVPLITDATATRLAELLRDGRPVLLELSGGSRCRSVAAAWSDRVKLIAAKTTEPSVVDAMLIRPDGHIAWAGDGTGPADTLHSALSELFGAA
ncbi:FAD-dependent monooxygenase [Saccharopolyspora spinosa]|uniref:2-polyprenyl-6-methoxyphenol hydroxylase-like FAD-dependent oxidoreductase n=1 Tax=Saccharopolyspora spinosa TaxID=60894 RepID=A0A2N3Y6A1_SACSN|nr:FAD-dependent monooxygenase [Saccharopolyspora spinosa]PKW18440.1 2-polyprenyl-6-methoxyphenol hydroxylase-like FAD-dependent oxidoreductase [Saccharopolyspora spinosa]